MCEVWSESNLNDRRWKNVKEVVKEFLQPHQQQPSKTYNDLTIMILQHKNE